MNPPRTGTAPCSISGATVARDAVAISSTSGAAQVWRSSVSTTSLASIQAAGRPDARMAAATTRLLSNSPVAATASSARGSAARQSSTACSSERRWEKWSLIAGTSAVSWPAPSAAAWAMCRARSSATPLSTSAVSPFLAASASPSSRSVTPASADTTTTGTCPRSRSADTMRITRVMADASATDEPPNFITTARIGPPALYFRKQPKKRPPVLVGPAAWSSDETGVSLHGRLHTTGLPARLARFRAMVWNAAATMESLVGEADGKQRFLILDRRLDTRLVEQLVDLVLDPGARVRGDGTECLPFSLGEVHSEKAAGVLAHARQVTATQFDHPNRII